ncbi:MAG: hypothetical protein JWN70_6745 [Planctomycetaceae bacterium]|nr:hypothetical protein [Planctomycetaceae bacterium]
MEVTRRDWFAAAALTGLAPALALAQDAAPAAAPAKTAAAPATAAKEAPAPGALNEETLKKMLEAIGLKPTQSQSRFDFAFALKPQGGEEWNLSMSAVLSSDGKTIWVMAWLDELPRSSRDVPRTALLKLLAENDLMGKGKFFSYIPANRRFALQQVIENHSMSTRKFHGMLVELGHTVIETYGFWSVEAWKEPASGESPNSDPNAGQQTTSTNNNTVNQPATNTTTAKPAVSATPSAGTGKPRTIATPTSNKK